jgi:hypothetical protein
MFLFYLVFESNDYYYDLRMRLNPITYYIQIFAIMALHIISFWFIIHIYFKNFSIYFISVTYIRYGFKQVNHKIQRFIRSSKNKSDYNLLMFAIEEHNQITILCMKDSKFVNLILLIVYYLYSPLIDMILYLTIYIDHFYIKLFGIFVTFVFILFLFLFSLTTAQLKNSAHLSYKNLNSIIAKQKRMPRAKKMRIIGLIERLAGPDIAVYCYDFFPLNNYEFYLFIASIAKNFFLLIGLID